MNKLFCRIFVGFRHFYLQNPTKIIQKKPINIEILGEYCTSLFGEIYVKCCIWVLWGALKNRLKWQMGHLWLYLTTSRTISISYLRVSQIYHLKLTDDTIRRID